MCGVGYDQGTFTEHVYLDLAAAHIFTSEHGASGQLGNSLHVGINSFGEALNEYGLPYAAVHQFDRFEFFTNIREERWPLNLSKFSVQD